MFGRPKAAGEFIAVGTGVGFGAGLGEL